MTIASLSARSAKIAAVLLAASLAASLAACGKTGPLVQPAPLFGAQAKSDYDAQQKANAAARAAKKAQPQAEVPDPASAPLPQAPYVQPIPGRSLPGGTPAPGALPNTSTPPGQ